MANKFLIPNFNFAAWTVKQFLNPQLLLAKRWQPYLLTMRLLLILTTFLLFTFCGQTVKQDMSIAMTTNSACDSVKKDFNNKLKEITWDEDQSNDKLIAADFFNKYLKDIREFKTKNEHMDLYYHSIPDIQTEKCLVIIKSVFKYDQYSYSYQLVNIGEQPKVLFELAALENYPDGQRRVKSIFLDDKTLRTTKVTEFLGDYDDELDKYEMITDSLNLTYKFQDNSFLLTKKDSIRTTKK